MNLDSGRLVALNVTVMDPSRLAEPRYVERFFRALIARINMKPLSDPMSVVVPPNSGNIEDQHADDGGMTTQCIISTSHIAFHSWPLQRRFRLVVDSCKDFSTADVLAQVGEWFAVKGMSVQDLAYEAPEMLHVQTEEATQEAQAAGPPT
jgi:hypothetical protein